MSSARVTSLTEPLLSHPEAEITPLEMVQHENPRAIGVQASALLFVGVIWSIVFSSFSPLSLPLFGFHPLIQSFAILLLVQAIVVLQRTSASQPAAKRSAFSAHQWLNLVLVLPLFTAGASIMWYLHDQPGTAHFISYHGILGTAVVVAAWVQAALGAASVWGRGRMVGGEAQGKKLWKWHRLSGYVLVVMFAATAVLGVVETTWASKNASMAQTLLVVVALALAVVALAIRIQKSKLPKF
ncbi:cytochrome b561 [Moesziomyces antarcticus]|uniref:Related to Cytochrome b561 n=2 Tax=Pseudozyma antarctica TaxID=84753 RepID=A0A5C3FQ68_PSEA2|nr:cytochrome b561 [Moesziomyces antarcticus]GAK64673.1 cytochrome b561 [Moesziomyces antarcticus]SPO45657.1 related to Cytochrome b561 [Moesziomyces antarcticus]